MTMGKLVLIKQQDEKDLRKVSVLGLFDNDLNNENVLNEINSIFANANQALIEDELYDEAEIKTMFKFLISNKKASNAIYSFMLLEI